MGRIICRTKEENPGKTHWASGLWTQIRGIWKNLTLWLHDYVGKEHHSLRKQSHKVPSGWSEEEREWTEVMMPAVMQPWLIPRSCLESGLNSQAFILPQWSVIGCGPTLEWLWPWARWLSAAEGTKSSGLSTPITPSSIHWRNAGRYISVSVPVASSFPRSPVVHDRCCNSSIHPARRRERRKSKYPISCMCHFCSVCC